MGFIPIALAHAPWQSLIMQSVVMVIRPFMFLIALAALPIFGGSNCMGKPCLDANDCVRECRCSFGATNEESNCLITYQCDYETDKCEAGYNDLSCDDICNDYAAAGLCGSRRCSADSNCYRSLSCSYLDSLGNSVVETCSYTFACDPSTQLCEQNFLLDDNSFCEFCINQN